MASSTVLCHKRDERAAERQEIERSVPPVAALQRARRRAI